MLRTSARRTARSSTAARSMGCRRSRLGTRSRSARSGSGSNGPGRERGPMTAAPAAARVRTVGREARRFRIQPRPRGRELTLLVLVGLALFVGAASLGATEQLHAAQLNGVSEPIDLLAPADAGLLAAYLGALLAVHLAFVIAHDVNGARLSLTIGPVSGQPSELLKVILVVFLAGYLSENRPLLVDES